AVDAGSGADAAAARGDGVLRSSTGAGDSRGAVEQATIAASSTPRIGAGHRRRPTRRNDIAMWVILLEALGALVLLLFIVWWTMFSGRRRGERPRDDDKRA